MKKAIIITAAVLVAAIGGAAVYIVNQRTANDEARRIYIPEGTTFDALCDTLDASPTFRLMAHALKLDERVHPGSYVVEARQSELTLVRKLRNGQQDPIRLTIGKFRLPQQLNEYLDQKLMHNDFNVTLDSFYLIRPNTYEFYWTVTPEQFMKRMEKEYKAFWANRKNATDIFLTEKTESNRIRINSDYSVRDIIVLASIVEEETNYNPEKPLIASVYLNRLRRGMPLQADPTVKYAVATSCPPGSGGLSASQTEGFALRRILNKHLAVESPFNTYLHTGLPPAPICLPSQASVDAVLNAPETQYIYFCASEKLDGTHRFAATLAEHNRNAARYHAAIR